jgi:acetyl-CoA decarbonylase/synthase complex subunit gamma
VATLGSVLLPSDRLGSWKARWGIGRMSYLVPPGLYALGRPGPEAPVVVTANYKMSYDCVRSALAGRHVWLLVLETFGINVWCAAGKGTFGTEELVRRIAQTKLAQVVEHRSLLLPILGAPGVAAHEVTRRSGFRIRYATIRATDLPEYLDNGQQTTAAMRELSFSLRERAVLIPVDLVLALKPTLAVAAALFLLGWIASGAGFGLALAGAFFGAVAAGAAATPLLLPWLPGRSFALKGALCGLAWSLLWCHLAMPEMSLPLLAGTTLALTAVSSFYGLNFTGSTPFTSPSGVRKELRRALPVMALSLATAAILWLGTVLF